MHKQNFFLICILIFSSFVEGGCLMAFEILSAKIYTPFLGASIYVWTSILTVTLIGLAFGYRVGGMFSKKEQTIYLLASSFFIAGIFVLLSTFIATVFLPMFLNFEIKLASIIAGFIILFIPVFFMGIISPLIVKQLNIIYCNLSKTTGMVYSIGTFGGILFTLLTVYFFIPNIGVQVSTFILSTLLILIAIGLVVFEKINANEKK